MNNYIKDCIKGNLYKISARNFTLAVYDGNMGFIGVRGKFKNEFLDTEYHWDKGPPFGTVKPLIDLGPIPNHIPIVEHLDTIDKNTGRIVAFDKINGWHFVDTKESSKEIVPVTQQNEKLFEFLKNYLKFSQVLEE